MNYTAPEMKVVKFENEEVIVASTGGNVAGGGTGNENADED